MQKFVNYGQESFITLGPGCKNLYYICPISIKMKMSLKLVQTDSSAFGAPTIKSYSLVIMLKGSKLACFSL